MRSLSKEEIDKFCNIDIDKIVRDMKAISEQMKILLVNFIVTSTTIS